MDEGHYPRPRDYVEEDRCFAAWSLIIGAVILGVLGWFL